MEYIAHFRVKNNKIETQSVKNHLDNVSKLSVEYAEGLQIENIVKLVAMLHDFGKYTDDFQDYIREAKERTVDGSYEEWLKTCDKPDHGVYGAYFIKNSFRGKDESAKLLADIASMIICYHHGGMNNCYEHFIVPIEERYKNVSQHQYETALKRFIEDNPQAETERLFKNALPELSSVLKKLMAFNKHRTFGLQLFIKLVYSILIDADRTDTADFMCDFIVKDKTLQTKYDTYIEKVENCLKAFNQKQTKSQNQRKINEIRRKISDECLESAKRNVGIYTLTVPTGGGKTLSSMRFALSHAKMNSLKRIIYVLPYTTIIEQNAKTIRKVLGCDDDILEFHCNVVNEDNNDEQTELITQKWNYPIIFTTVVQYLNIFYAKGTKSQRRLNCLKDSVIIFDEVQKIPTKCLYLFNHSINFLNRICNSTVLLCTATQPRLDKLEQPVFYSENSELMSDTGYLFKALKRIKIIDKRKDGGYTYSEAGEFLSELQSEGKSVLMVTNKVKSADEIYKLLRNQYRESQVYYLSTRLCPAQRTDILNVIRDKLEKNEKIICVSTQLIEAGVDISFDTAVRSLCGLDSIAQASGRANRNGECEMGCSYIINLSEEINIKPDRTNTENKKISNGLDEIVLGAQTTEILLDKIKSDKTAFNGDLLSPPAVEEYFRKFFADQDSEAKMEYPVKDDSETICDMLSYRKIRATEYRDKFGKDLPISINYRFKTAADNFRVIDNVTESVVVPYKEGKNIILALNSNRSLKEKIELIKKAQQYTVNIYKYIFDKLRSEKAITDCEIKGVYCLSEDWFSETRGLLLQKEMKFLQV